MAGRASSPVLVGRERPMEALLHAVGRATAESRCVVLVEGEAGIGKTRFLAEFAREIGRRPITEAARIVVGQCVQLTEGSLPFGPIVEVLDELTRSDVGQLVPGIVRLRDDLSGALPGTDASSAGSRGRLFLELRHTLEAIARDRPLIVVIDDVHWADRSTLDLLAYLANRPATTSVTLVLAYRSDELDRRHPLRPVLAELQRGRILDRIILGPLEPHAAADQIRTIVGVDVDEGFARRVIELADGNPFHVEELLALGGPWSSLPVSLRNVLLARIDRLDQTVLSVVREAAVIGRELDESLLATVSGLPELELREALRSAVDQFIFAPTADGLRYRFRHALLREAVYEELLPADRVGLHRRVADALAGGRGRGVASPAGAAGELARHRDAGQQLDLARQAYIVAGELAMRARAWTEAAAAFERVLEIDAARDDSTERLDVQFVRTAMHAIWFAGRPHQADELLSAFVERSGHRLDPAAVADAWLDLSRVRNDLGDEAGSREAGRRAIATAPRRPANPARAKAMAGLASGYMIEGRHRRAIRLASCVIAMADGLDASDVKVIALAQRGPALLALGRTVEAMNDFVEARRIAEALHDPDPLGLLLYNVGATFVAVGAFETGLALILEASSIGHDLGLEQTWDPWLRAAAAQYAYWLGRWVEADRHIAIARGLELNGPPLAMAASVQAMLAAQRGESVAATRLIAEATEAARESGELAAPWRAAQARAFLIAGEPERTIAAIDEGLSVLAVGDELAARALLASMGAEAAADLAQRMASRRDTVAASSWTDRALGYVRLTDHIATGRLVRGSLGSPITQGLAALALAHANRASGAADPDAWAAAVAAFEGMGALPTAAWARFWLAEAALMRGDRPRAAESLLMSRTTAATVGDLALQSAVAGLARRGRLDLDEGLEREAKVTSARPGRASNPWKLSDRESEVLAHVADGLTNREIARRLFITEKTASSHVTHILDKLGVSSRTEAALAAARAGLLASPGDTTAKRSDEAGTQP